MQSMPFSRGVWGHAPQEIFEKSGVTRLNLVAILANKCMLDAMHATN